MPLSKQTPHTRLLNALSSAGELAETVASAMSDKRRQSKQKAVQKAQEIESMKAEMLRMYEDCKRAGVIVEVGDGDRSENRQSVDVCRDVIRPSAKDGHAPHFETSQSFDLTRARGRNTLAPPPTAVDVIAVKRDNLRRIETQGKDRHAASFTFGASAGAPQAFGDGPRTRVLESPPRKTGLHMTATQHKGDMVTATTPTRTSLELSRNSQDSSTASSCTTLPHADTRSSPQHAAAGSEKKQGAADCSESVSNNVAGANVRNVGGNGGGGGRLWWAWLRTACRKFYMPRRNP